MAITPNRVVRIPDELWHPAKERAAERGENITEVIRRALARYVEEHDCWEHSVEYESDGPLGHGWECGLCGALLQVG